jgi:uncharacterized protein
MTSVTEQWIDGDMHVTEPVDFWETYLDAKYKEWAPRWLGTPGEDHPLMFVTKKWAIGSQAATLAAGADPERPDDVIARTKRFPRVQQYLNADGNIGPSDQLRALDAEGIATAILFPSNGAIGLGLPSMPVEAQYALTRAATNWISDFCRHDPKRLKFVGIVPFTDVKATVAEIRRMSTELGAVGVWPFISRPEVHRLYDPMYEPVWEEAERDGIVLAFHGTQNFYFRDRYRDNVPLAYVTGRSVEHAVTLSELIMGGVLEHHPDLRCVFLEAGCSWAYHYLYRLEGIWEEYRNASADLAKNVRMRPVDYWRRQCFSSVESDEWTLSGMIEIAGDESFIYASDFPHLDSSFPYAREKFMQIPGLSDAARQKILRDNCRRLFGID